MPASARPSPSTTPSLSLWRPAGIRPPRSVRAPCSRRSAAQAQGGLGLRWRLFDFGRVDAQIAPARGRQAEALAAYRLAALRAAQDVEDAFSALVKREDQARILARGRGLPATCQAGRRSRLSRRRGQPHRVLDADGGCCKRATASRRREPNPRARRSPRSGRWEAAGTPPPPRQSPGRPLRTDAAPGSIHRRHDHLLRLRQAGVVGVMLALGQRDAGMLHSP